MNLEVWFSTTSNFAMAGWLLLAIYPRRKAWVFSLTGLAMPALMGIAYAVLMIPNMADVDGAGYGSLSQVSALFSNDALLLAGWIHYLAFDLAVGTYIAMKSDDMGLSRIVQLPLLFLALMFGPVGLMAFVFIKSMNKASGLIYKGAAK